MNLTVNGREHEITSAPLTPLLHVLREELEITSPKAGCQQGGCGTCTVLVERYVKHPKYKKYMKLSKKFLVHDKGNTATVGSKVVIRETKPLSKLKRFELAEILKVATVETE